MPETMQKNNNHVGTIQELRNNLAYQKHLFNLQRKEGANFESLKKILIQVRELEKNIQLLKINSSKNIHF